MYKETQRQKVLRLLRESGKSGLNSHDLTYIHGIKQAPTRIYELIEKGYKISSSAPHKNRSIDYVLDYEPEELKKPIRYEFIDNKAIPIFR